MGSIMFDKIYIGCMGECDVDVDVDGKRRVAEHLALVKVRARVASYLLGRF